MMTGPLNFLTGSGIEKKLDRQDRKALILKYVPLVKNIVERMVMRFPGNVETDDLINTGIMGLMAVLEKFDETRNVNLVHMRVSGFGEPYWTK